MTILFLSLIFGLAVLFLLLKFMGNVKMQLRDTGSQKVRAVLKLILLVEDAVFILIFVVVIIKTLIL